MLRILQAEVATQCRFIITAADELAAAPNQPVTPGPGLTDPFWRPLQTILVSAANLSKMFWGQNETIAARRQPLRRPLRVTKRSPLYSREVRNHFEHFDEKVENWFAATSTTIFVGRNVGPDKIVKTKDRFAHYDPSTRRVTFLGHSMSLDRVVQEAQRILPLAEAESLKF